MSQQKMLTLKQLFCQWNKPDKMQTSAGDMRNYKSPFQANSYHQTANITAPATAFHP